MFFLCKSPSVSFYLLFVNHAPICPQEAGSRQASVALSDCHILETCAKISSEWDVGPFRPAARVLLCVAQNARSVRTVSASQVLSVGVPAQIEPHSFTTWQFAASAHTSGMSDASLAVALFSVIRHSLRCPPVCSLQGRGLQDKGVQSQVSCLWTPSCMCQHSFHGSVRTLTQHCWPRAVSII